MVSSNYCLHHYHWCILNKGYLIIYVQIAELDMELTALHRLIAGADLEGGVGGPNQGVWGTKVPQWGPRAKPRRGSGDRVPQKLEHVKKYTTLILRPCENERHNLMLLM